MQTFKNFYKLGILVILFVWSFFIFFWGDKSPIQIGYVAGLTGRYSQLAISVRNGVILAIDTLNKTGGVNGRQLQLIVRDDKSDIGEGAKVFAELIKMKIPVVIGPLLSKMAATTLQTIKGQNILVISPTISTDAILDLDDNFLRVIPSSSFLTEITSTAIAKTDHKSVAIVYNLTNRAYTEPIYASFKKHMAEAGIKLVYANSLTNTKTKDFLEIANEIIAAAPEGLFFVTSSIDAGEICQQIRKNNSTIKFYGSHWARSGKIIEIGGRSVEGMYFASTYESNIKSEPYKEFYAKFVDSFKSAPGFPSIYGYDAVMIMAEGMRSSKSTDPKKIKTAILAKTEFEGLEETFRINQYGDAERSPSLVQIEDGHFVRIDL